VADANGPTVAFETTLTGVGNNTGIELSADHIAQLGAGKRPAVVVDVNGYRYRTTVGVMGGKHMIGVSAAIRKETGLRAGDPIAVTLAVATTPRSVDVPPDLAAALDAHPEAGRFFASLSNSLQRYHVDNINGAKAAETRQRRVDVTIEKFLAGKQR
jgi:hypothetical protein